MKSETPCTSETTLMSCDGNVVGLCCTFSRTDKVNSKYILVTINLTYVKSIQYFITRKTKKVGKVLYSW